MLPEGGGLWGDTTNYITEKVGDLLIGLSSFLVNWE